MSQFLASSLIGWRRWAYLPSVVSMATELVEAGFFFRRCPVEEQVTTRPTDQNPLGRRLETSSS